MNTVAIIPARGGSKGIPRKNIYPFRGKPLICWNIDAALRAEHVDRVIVSTDNAEIAEIARSAGAIVVMRPDDISSDIASSEDALIHTLKSLDSQPELTVFLQCTSPLTQSDDIDRCIKKLIDTNADSAFTATESHRFLWKNPDAATGVNHDGAERKRRQDLEKEYAENGAVYVMKTEGFLQSRHRFFGKTVISEMPLTRTWEIDSHEDLHVAEALAELWTQPTELPEPVEAVVFDFDGVMTDNAVYVTEMGEESVRCDRGDGWGIARLRDAGIRMAVMSTEENPVVQARCTKLKLECFHQLGDRKISRLQDWCKQHQLNLNNIIYVGNDENDIECLMTAGTGIVPSDAHDSARQVADIVLSTQGGHGAVRELCDMILNKEKR
ncbi:acylneuraminate cytidylyltransferase [Pontiellaceae bacterium B12219]|nr:acylneuraminate cytidylyltransferase [Pontiellaceae bacterium B12219]